MNNLYYQLALFIDRFLVPSETHLHTARFARLHETTSLSTAGFDQEGLLLGVGKLERLLQVQSMPTRRELGNVLVVAPPAEERGSWLSASF